MITAATQPVPPEIILQILRADIGLQEKKDPNITRIPRSKEIIKNKITDLYYIHYTYYFSRIDGI